jgi:ABC-type dipeptide/oligopeptide/nickel transport system permease component
MSWLAAAGELTLGSSSLLLLLASVVGIAAGVAGGVLIGPKDNKSTSALMGGALTAVAVIPGLVVGFVVGLLR